MSHKRTKQEVKAYDDGYANGFLCGVDEGRETGKKLVVEDQKARRELETWRLRTQAIDAMAHAIRAMADELHR